MQPYRVMLIVLFCLLVWTLNGCASTKANSTTLQIQQFQTQLARMEKEIEQKESRIRYLEDRMEESKKAKAADTALVKNKPSTNIKTKTGPSNNVISQATPKKIQAALKKAGFYNGSVDGRIGDRTKEAIRDFQKSNGLKCDGVVGKETWSKLSKYLD